MDRKYINESKYASNSIEAKQFDGQDEVVTMPLIKKREITILLLSETGVGKSTFINAFVNYMSFESMDAANGRPICLIPVSFTITDPKTRLPVKVTLGNQNDNENTGDPTQSATKYPKCYTFETEKIVLNIIDTPGIADTDGVERDNKNMQNILDFISNYREINAFCVLLKPNEPRVGAVFKHCIFQLFTHLNKSAANNILFLFTNSRSTHYMPGESGPALIKILDQIRENPPNVDIPYNENTVYSFDSESFRYLVASVPPNNIQFDPKYKSSYVDSWDQSVEECQRLFDRIIQLTPHKVMDTLSVNNTKQIIQLLIKPLADISKNIADNVNQCERHKREVNDCKGTIDELRTKLDIPSVEIISVPLDRPQTVCCAEQCIERVTNHGVTHTNYKTKCHSPCYLSFSDGNIVDNSGLLRCKAFNDYFTKQKECHECGHSYNQHMHLVNETQSKLTMVRDPEVDTAIESTRSAAEAKELLIRGLDQRIAEMKAENDTIVQSMSMFACFLTNNALTPINDAFEEYVRHLIANERQNTFGADSWATITRLEQVLRQYNDEKQIIIREMDGSAAAGAKGSAITIQEIDNLVNKLCSLKHKGPEIRAMLDQLKQTKVAHNADANKVRYKPRVNNSFMFTLFSNMDEYTLARMI
ncbi:unnamed protein product [Medioppia subpectinata]|uniref:DUF8206 domain-containing protein n=1 Tax=Medioppia subpectinata TaxID=1979941 RepID=A0A7R9KPS9_9ACAR|nr:unnamed protein product [Medioppia subpectinata]CAG2107440.1 unnamed protein product [Medioppia subpectinata]